MIPSKYQEAIYEEIRNGDKNIIIKAVAGSGKTTALVKSTTNIPKGSMAQCVSFSKEAVSHLSNKLAENKSSANAVTAHSIGYRSIASHLRAKLNVDGQKFTKLAEKVLDGYKHRGNVVELANMVRVTMLNIDNDNEILDLADNYNIEYPEGNLDEKSNEQEKFFFEKEDATQIFLSKLRLLLSEGEKQVISDRVIDFADMIYIPVIWKTKKEAVDYLFVDECQDLSPMQISLLTSIPAGRVLCVGDPCQAIYGFAGADCLSYENVKKSFNANELPLSVCYRCPKLVVDMAKEIVSYIEEAENAPLGVISKAYLDELPKKVNIDDMVLSRKTAPLVSLIFKMYKAGIPARFVGNDMGKMFLKTIDRFTKYRGFSYERFQKYCNLYFERKIRNAQKKENMAQVNRLCDEMDVILTLHENIKATSLYEFIDKVSAVFDTNKPGVKLLTVHRSKGLENNKIFLLEDGLPLRWKWQLRWQFEQEMNLKYVGITRAKTELCLVS